MIELSDVHVTFNPGTPLETKALRGVSLNVPEGQFLTVIGSNGAGKSTCLNLIAGLCRPASGTVAVAGDDISDWPIYRRSKFLSRVFQDPKMGTCEDLTILENFALAQGRTRPRGFRMAVTRTIKDEAAERLKVLGLGLESRLHDKVGLLSGGQRQAVSLLMATAALDPKTAGFVLELTQSIVAELKLTVVMVTHSMAQALHVGDRTVMFHRGRIVTDIDGPKRAAMHVNDLLALFKQEQHEELSDDALLLG